MKHFQIDLSELYPALEGISTPLSAYLPDFSPEVSRLIRRPAVIICPGGGYQGLSDREGEPLALRLMGQGFQAFVLRYALAPDHHYPTQLYQVAAAMDFVRSHAAENRTGKTAVMGASAGGHLAAMLATLHADPDLLRAFGKKAGDFRPDAAVLSYPVITSKAGLTHGGSIQNISGGDEKIAAFLSLEERVTADTPPCFLWHTMADDCVPVENSLMFAAALRRQGVPFELHIFEQGGHGYSLADFTTDPGNGLLPNDPHIARWEKLMVEWLKKRGFDFGD